MDQFSVLHHACFERVEYWHLESLPFRTLMSPKSVGRLLVPRIMRNKLLPFWPSQSSKSYSVKINTSKTAREFQRCFIQSMGKPSAPQQKTHFVWPKRPHHPLPAFLFPGQSWTHRSNLPQGSNSSVPLLGKLLPDSSTSYHSSFRFPLRCSFPAFLSCCFLPWPQSKSDHLSTL